MSAFFVRAARRHMFRGIVCLAAAAAPFQPLSSAVLAHHAAHELSVPSPTCGWIEGDTLRDRSNLEEFCAASVPGYLRIRSAMADRERLWLEAPPELASNLRGDDRSTAALLRNWLERWRTVSGYKTAAVTLMRSHVEFARVHTTMAGDAVTVR